MLVMLQLAFCITCFQSCCSCLGGEHNSAKRLQAVLIRNFTFDPQTESIRAFLSSYLLFSLFWPFRPPFVRSMPSSKYCFWLPCRAFFAPRAPSAKMSVCIVAAILSISCTICWFLCAFHASNTFFYKISSYYLKIWSPPSVGSMILKAVHKQDHEKYASYALSLGHSAPALHLL